jgi:hypothetical protein
MFVALAASAYGMADSILDEDNDMASEYHWIVTRLGFTI